MDKKRKIGRKELMERFDALKPGESLKIDHRELDQEARELGFLAQPAVYLGQALRGLSDREAIKHAVDILSAQIRIVLRKRGVDPPKRASLTKRIKLLARLEPAVLDQRTLQMLRELNSIYIHFHDATLQTFGDEDPVIDCIDRLIAPPPAADSSWITLRVRVEMGLQVVAGTLDTAGGNSSDS